MSSSESSRFSGPGWLAVIALVAAAGLAVLWLLPAGDLPPPPAEDPQAARAPEDPADQDDASPKAPAIPFTDIADPSGVTFSSRGGATGEKMLPESGGAGCAFIDYDGDGDPDLLLISGRPWPWDEGADEPQPSSLALYRNDGEHFTDVTEGAGLVADFYGQGAAVGDYDGDGDDDLFITAVGPDRLYRNDKGKFVDVTAETGDLGDSEAWTTSAGFFDYDGDGDLDLFACNYVDWNRERDQAAVRRVPGTGLSYAHPGNFDGTQNFLFRNDGGVFTNVSAEAGMEVHDPKTGLPLGKALAVTFVDFDGDGRLDVFVANDTVRHFLYHNLGDGRFEEVGEDRGFALNSLGVTTSGMGIDAAWLYNDERLAVAVSNFAGEMTELYVAPDTSADAFFTDEAVATGVAKPTNESLTFGLLFDDFDLDGRPDLVHANGHLEETINAVQPSQRYRQSAQLFWNRGAESGPVLAPVPSENLGDLTTPIVGRAVASADLDADGDLDLVFTQVDGPPLIARNDQKLGRNWITVKLEGKQGNPHAIGAVVELKANGATQRRVVMPTRSYLAQSEPIATFGLGKATAVESLRVRWPDGSEKTISIDGVDQRVTVRQETETFAALANTAKAELENAEFEAAIATLKRALELRPDSGPTQRNLARAFLLGGQPDASLEQLEALDGPAAGAEAGVAYLKGLAAIRKGQQSEAVDYFRTAARLDPKEATLHFQLALALAALGETDEAQKELETTADLDPLHGGAQYQLATYARKSGDRDGFRRYMRDYQRIRNVKGAADALALEECRYTKPEPMIDPTGVAKKSDVELGWSLSTFADAQPMVAAAVVAMDDSGAYRLAGLTTEGALALFEFDEAGAYRELSISEPLIDGPIDRAVLRVGNALVDSPVRNPEAEQDGDFPEIVVVTPIGSRIVRYGADQQLEDLTDKSGLIEVRGEGAFWVDLDHDGDIDLGVLSDGKLQAWRNNGDGAFSLATDEFGLGSAGSSADVAAVDLDGVNLGVDLIGAGPDGAWLMRNQFGGEFAAEPATAAAWPSADMLLADDFTADGSPDLAFLNAGRLTICPNGGAVGQTLDLPLDSLEAATTIDADNDGWLDIAVAGKASDEPKLILLRNNGGEFTLAPVDADATATLSRGGLLDLDADNDGDTDLLVVGSDGQLSLLTNETPTDNRQLKLSIRSFAGHPSSIGVRVQVRSEGAAVTRWTRREVPIEVGVNGLSRADSVQTLWLNGVARNEIGVDLGDEPLRITIIEFVRTSSCPFLYAWVDGAWQFVTDLLGTAPLNVSVARGVPMPPDPDEVVVIGPADRFADAEGNVKLRVTSELREAVYLDNLRLLTVDHPEGSRVFSLDRATTAPVSGVQVVAGRDPIGLRSAVGSDGLDRTEALADEDAVFAEPGALLPYPAVGYTEPLSVEFDFGELPESDDLLLVLTGWFRFGDSSTNIAASQRGDLQPIWPKLEVAGPDGEWRLVDDAVGFPAGNPKSIVCDLRGKLPADARRFRLTTSFEVRWDCFKLYHALPDDALTIQQHEPAVADLGWHGFAELRQESLAVPQTPDPERISDTPPWLTTLEGWCTRYGDVRELVTEPDERLTILNAGDGLTLEFAAAGDAAAGAERTLLLHHLGWIKEENPNSLPDRRVAPFPGSDRAEDPPESDWQVRYNTRWEPRRRFDEDGPGSP